MANVPSRTFSADVGQASTGNAGPDAIEVDISALITFLTALKSVIDSDSGADNIGATAIADLTGSTVQALLESLRDKLKATTDGASGADFVKMTPITETGAADTIQTITEALVTLVNGKVAATDVSITPGVSKIPKTDTNGILTLPNQSTFMARRTTTSVAMNGGWVKVTFPTEIFDQNNEYDTATSRFTAMVAGVYAITGSIWLKDIPGDSRVGLSVYVNGAKSTTLFDYNIGGSGSLLDPALNGTCILKLNANDYVELYALAPNGEAVDGDANATYFSMAKLA